MVRLVDPNDGYPDWYLRQFRRPVNFGPRFMGKTRQKYIEAFKGLGFEEGICECEFRFKDLHDKKTIRYSNKAMAECAECGELIWPHNYIHICDECCEYTLSKEAMVPIKGEFLCEFCE